MSTQGHEKEAVNVEGLKAALKSSGNKAIYNEAICSTAGGTAAKVTNTVPPSFSLVSGAKILVKFTYAITVANATLQVGTNAAKPIFYHGAALAANLVKAGTLLLLDYDGTNFNIVGDINTDTTYQVMGASGASHASGLVPDTPSTAGTTKFLREDGTWQEVSASPEVQIGGNTPSSESDIKLFVDESADDTVEVYTKAQADGQFMVIVNSNSAPTSSTLTYTATDGTTKSFKTGDEIRVPDVEADNGYTFYKLYALTTESDVTTATWDKLGGGGSVNPNETVNISLTQVGGNSTDLIGASITITDDDTSEILLSTTWDGNYISTEIYVGTRYTVTVDTITGYKVTTSKSYTAQFSYERNVDFLYAALGIFIESTDHLLYTSSNWSSSGKTVNAVVVITEACSFRLAISELKKPVHKNATDPLNNYLPTLTETQAKADYDGVGNTAKIIQFNEAYGTNTTSYAAPYCKAFRFPDGTTEGALPSLGQLYVAYQNKTSINTCLSTCGGTALAQAYNWTSSFWGMAGNSRGMFYIDLTAGSVSSTSLEGNVNMRIVGQYL